MKKGGKEEGGGAGGKLKVTELNFPLEVEEEGDPREGRDRGRSDRVDIETGQSPGTTRERNQEKGREGKGA